MKKVRFVLAMILVLAMLTAAPLSALAATWDAETSDDVANAFCNDTDAEVIVNMKNDIAMWVGLSTNEGQSYTINGNGYTIADVYIYGDGSTEINADVTSDGQYVALEVSDTAQVTVNGDVYTQDVSGDESSAADAVIAENNAQVTVNGDVTGGSGSLTDEELQDGAAYSDGGNGVKAYDNAQITVNGDVTGGDAMGTYGYAGDGVYVEGNAQVTVSGNVTGGSVTADPDVVGRESYGGYGVYMENTASVSVGGDVTGGSTNGNGGDGGDGICVEEYGSAATGSVKVGGTVTAGAGGEDGKDGTAVNLGETVYDICLEDALDADPADIAEEVIAANEAGEDWIETKYGALAIAIELMYENGDLTDEEMDAYEKAYESLLDQCETEEEYLTATIGIIQEVIAKEASSDNLLALRGAIPDMDINKVSDAVGQAFSSVFGARSAELYSQTKVVSSSGSNPQTGEAPTALILGAVMIVSLLGVTALVVARKKTA